MTRLPDDELEGIGTNPSLKPFISQLPDGDEFKLDYFVFKKKINQGISTQQGFYDFILYIISTHEFPCQNLSFDKP